MPEFFISPTLKGYMTNYDCLINVGSILFKTTRQITKGGAIFQVKDESFSFSFSMFNDKIEANRNGNGVFLDISKIPIKTPLSIGLSWDFTSLILRCQFGPRKGDILEKEISTIPCSPPMSLITWARKENLIPKKKYNTNQDFRTKVNACIQEIQKKINEAGCYYSFWNVKYEGKKILSRDPKKETEVHPIIHCLLSDQAIISSFEIVPEYKTGIGNLDFLIIGQLINGETSKVCIEFKNAHSPDIVHGLIDQLPIYMRNSEAEYGIYGVFNYTGEWFKTNPKFSIECDMGFELAIEQQKNKDSIGDNIRIIIIDLGKPKSASIK